MSFLPQTLITVYHLYFKTQSTLPTLPHMVTACLQRMLITLSNKTVPKCCLSSPLPAGALFVLELEFNFERGCCDRKWLGEEELDEADGCALNGAYSTHSQDQTVGLGKPLKGTPYSHLSPSFQLKVGRCGRHRNGGKAFLSRMRGSPIVYITTESDIWFSCWPEWHLEKWKHSHLQNVNETKEWVEWLLITTQCKNF